MSHAAEILGRATAHRPADGAVWVLETLLEHASAPVREGAIYGLAYHLDPRVRQVLERVAREDASDGVREAAEETLED